MRPPLSRQIHALAQESPANSEVEGQVLLLQIFPEFLLLLHVLRPARKRMARIELMVIMISRYLIM